MKGGTIVFAIVGYGGMGSQHHRQLDRVEGALVKGVWDILPERRRAAVEAGVMAYSSFEAVLADSEVDVVLVATPNDMHRPLSVAALEAGKNVICEKPASVSASEFERMTEAAKKSGKLLVVHQNRRWDSDYLTIKRIVDSGMIGDVYRVESRIHGSRGIPGDWRKREAQGGGMVLDWGVHLLDRLLLLFPRRIERVYCKLFYPTGQEVDEGFVIDLDFEGGVSALAEVGTCNYISLPIWYACGDRGSALIEDWSMKGRVARPKGSGGDDAKPVVAGAGLTKTMAGRDERTVETLPLPIVAEDEKDFYRNVMAAVRGEAAPLVRNDQVLRVLRLVEAAFRSAREGQAVSFE
jgi:Predicted dehydrogenases and related proteins